MQENEKGKPNPDTWCDEFYDCINEITYKGALKYAPRDWELPEGAAITPKKNCDSMFHHLARTYVEQELKEDIKNVRRAVKLSYLALDTTVFNAIETLLNKLELDAEFGTSHLQHLACRAVMGYTRKVRGLD